jgi:heat-inducible transcriptional repressor
MSLDLNKRHQQILWATIRQYVATAEPVGSKALVDGYNLNVSPATIRSGFSTLEKAGLLYQPHTSAGRIPSDSGYRLYVDRLLGYSSSGGSGASTWRLPPGCVRQDNLRELTPLLGYGSSVGNMQPSLDIGRQVEELLHEKLDWDGWSLEAVLRGAAEVLATLSGYITMITLPQTQHSTIKHIQFVPVEATKIMLVVVLDSYQTQSILMQLPQDRDLPIDGDLRDRELQVLSNFLNSKLRGRSLLTISTLDWNELDREFQHYVDLVSNLLVDLSRQAQPTHSSQIMIRGIAEVLRQPEFSELHQVKTLLHLLESEQEQLWQLIFDPRQMDMPTLVNRQSDFHPKISIKIGAENLLEPMQTCTLISTTYQQDSIPVGSVGLLGPKRMLYENAIALVQSAADYISESISHESRS